MDQRLTIQYEGPDMLWHKTNSIAVTLESCTILALADIKRIIARYFGPNFNCLAEVQISGIDEDLFDTLNEVDQKNIINLIIEDTGVDKIWFTD